MQRITYDVKCYTSDKRVSFEWFRSVWYIVHHRFNTETSGWFGFFNRCYPFFQPFRPLSRQCTTNGRKYEPSNFHLWLARTIKRSNNPFPWNHHQIQVIPSRNNVKCLVGKGVRLHVAYIFERQPRLLGLYLHLIFFYLTRSKHSYNFQYRWFTRRRDGPPIFSFIP